MSNLPPDAVRTVVLYIVGGVAGLALFALLFVAATAVPEYALYGAAFGAAMGVANIFANRPRK